MSPTQPVAICYAGLPGAGKSTAAEIGQDLLGGSMFNMGRAVRFAFKADYGENGESQSLGRYASYRRDADGPGWVAQEMVDDWTGKGIQGETFEVPFHVDGLRSPAELDVFDHYFGSVYLVYVHAPISTRLRRLRERQRDGEETFTMRDLEDRDLREIEWGAWELRTYSQAELQNRWGKADLRDQVEAAFDGFGLAFRPASDL